MDKLDEIKARHDDPAERYRYDARQYDDIAWLIAEVERLREIEAQWKDDFENYRLG